jgi:hypothetical protein
MATKATKATNVDLQNTCRRDLEDPDDINTEKDVMNVCGTTSTINQVF